MPRPKGFIAIPKRLQNKSPSYLSTYQKYIQKAKALDERLNEIEKSLARGTEYEREMKRAYREAYATARARQHIAKDSRPRFNRTAWITSRTSEKTLEKALAEVEKLLANPLTSLSGIKSYKRAEKQAIKASKTLFKRYGVKVKPWELKNVFESLNWEKLKESYGSKTAIKAIGTIQSKGKKWAKQIEKATTSQLNTLDIGEKVAADIIRKGLYG